MAVAAAVSADDVFINCPFDRAYTPIFRALVFCIYAGKFRPRSARELDDGGQLRMEKLYGLIEGCRFGVHDLSRTELDEVFALPRFNMPLELGLFLGAKRYRSKAQKLKRALILDIEPFRYQRFISDLAGIDIHAHGSDPAHAIVETRDWLANVSRRKLPSGAHVARLYRQFHADLPTICRGLEFDSANIPYVDFERIVTNWLIEAPAS